MKQLVRLITIGVLFIGLVRSYIPDVKAQNEICSAQFISVANPLTELGDQEYIRMDGQATGFIGGLYPNGSNQPPTSHANAGLYQAGLIQPLNVNGQPDLDNGKIVMISIGMSNTNSEFGSFIDLAQNDPEINDALLLVNGALANQTSDRWINPDEIAWQVLADQLENLQISPLQVQVAWIKLTQTGGGDFPEKAQALQADLEIIVRNLKNAYPNVRIAYFSSRIYSYTYERGLSPEPNAYETGFAVRWLIEKQINGDPTLNYDPREGEVTSPLLMWGPYLWADGENPREDGLTWLKEDLTQDCTHPNGSGQQKVATMLMEFFKSDLTTTSWFSPNSTVPEEYKLFIPFLENAAGEPMLLNEESTFVPTVQVLSTVGIPTSVIHTDKQKPTNIFRLFFDWIKHLFKGIL